jgi:hypothetical protein
LQLRSQYPETFKRTKIDIEKLELELIKDTDDIQDDALKRFEVLHSKIEDGLKQSTEFFDWLTEQPLQQLEQTHRSFTMFTD